MSKIGERLTKLRNALRTNLGGSEPSAAAAPELSPDIAREVPEMSSAVPSRRASALIQGRISTEHDMRDGLTLLVAQAGSQKAAADSLGISQAYLGDMLLGRRPVSRLVAERMGWTKVEIFVKNDSTSF
jgi:hypothetical protein